MDGTLWKLCVRYVPIRLRCIYRINPSCRLTGSEMMIGEPSPHAAEISKVGWRQFGSLSFNYRTKGEVLSRFVVPASCSPWGVDELQSGRIRGIEIPQKQVSPFDMSTVSSVGKRRREMTSDGTSPSRKRRDRPSADTIWKAHPSATKDNSSSPNASNHLENSEDTIRVVRFSPLKKLRKTPSFECSPVPEFEPTVITLSSPLTSWTPNSLQVNSDASGNSLRKSASRPSMESSLSNSSAAHSTEPATYVVSPAANPAELILLPSSPPSQSSPQPQPRHSAVIPTITSPSTPLHDSPEPEQSVAASINEADRVVIALTTFLDEVSPFRPLGLSTKDLQEAGISTLAELRIIAHKPEVFRTKISVLADLCERDRYLWMMFRKGLKKLLGEDHREQSAGDPIHETDPVGKFVRSLGGGGCIESEALVSGLRGAGISSEKDLLVLSRNLDKYTENIPFLREFATTKKFGWMVFQVGLEGLPGQKVSTSIQTQDHGASGEGHAFVKWFLDTIDPDKPLGHLADSFVEQGLNDRVPLLHVAEDIEIAVDCIPFLQDLASGDQLIWAMILVGLENLTKSV